MLIKHLQEYVSTIFPLIHNIAWYFQMLCSYLSTSHARISWSRSIYFCKLIALYLQILWSALRITETDAEIEARLDKWDEFLEQEDEKEKKGGDEGGKS